MDSDNSFFEKKYPALHEAEREMERERELYFLGMKIFEELSTSGIDQNNSFEMDAFLEIRPSFHLEALAFYQDYIKDLEQSLTKPDQQIATQSPIDAETIARAINQKQYTKEENPRLSELLSVWEKEKKALMAKSSFSEYGRETRFFVRVVTEHSNGKSPRIADLNVSMIRHYRDVFSSIPKGVKTSGKTIDELVSKQGTSKSKSTLKDTYQKVGGFINWAIQKGYPVQNNIHPVLTAFDRIKAKEKKNRVPFDNDDLKAIFLSDRYTKGDFKRASDYWMPLIALFTGGTLAELAQLYTKDVYRDGSGIWVIDINEKDDKKLKTTDGRPRLVPLHPMLKKMGFIKFTEFREKNNEIKLFPCEHRNAGDKFGAFSNRFRNYRDKVNAGPRNEQEFRDFHSFRHLVRTKLSELGKTGKGSERFDEGLIDDIVGHTSSQRSMGKRVYTHSDLVKAKYNALKRLEYNLEFSKIAEWDACQFYRQHFNS